MKPRPNLPQPERPRERLLELGPTSLTSAELLAILLRTGRRGQSAVALGQTLLTRFGGLRALLCANAASLMEVDGLGMAKACEVMAINELARRALQETLQTGTVLNQPDHVKQFCTASIGHLKIEHCIALYLDSQLRLIASEEVSRGTLNQASVYPREVVKAALKHHAAALILAHNHPSGVAEASHADLSLTRHLKSALTLVDIRLLDHLIVTPTGAVSLAETGQL
jgi:DNA repair protein RadC